MAKSMMMEGLARGYDLGTKEGVDRWLAAKQAEEIATIEAERGLASGGMSLLDRIRRVVGLAPTEIGSGAEEPTQAVQSQPEAEPALAKR